MPRLIRNLEFLSRVVLALFFSTVISEVIERPERSDGRACLRKSKQRRSSREIFVA